MKKPNRLGRPAILTGGYTKPYAVTLDEHYATAIRNHGQGNLSAGVRLLAAALLDVSGTKGNVK